MAISTIDSNGLTNPLTSGVTTNTITSATSTALTLKSAGTTAVTIDTSQNVGIGTSSPNKTGYTAPVLSITNGTSGIVELIGNQTSDGTVGQLAWYNNSATSPDRVAQILGLRSGANNSGAIAFQTNSAGGGATERMRITSAGYVGLNTNSPTSLLDVRGGSAIFSANGTTTAGQEFTFINGGDRYILTHGTSLSSATQMYFANPNGNVGSISTSGTTTSYNTSSDYRLKDNVKPMQNALERVALLKPVTFTWNTDGADGEGFIAHELQKVVPIAVHGEKDAVEDYGDVLNEDGSVRYSDVRTPTTPEEGTTFVKKGERPVYQAVDTSHLIATLTAAIQELKAINDQQAETINALTARIEALENK